MKKFNNFKDSDAVSLDFEKIEDEVSENINSETNINIKRKKFRSFKLNKFLRYAVCIMLTCVVSVGSTLLIQGSILIKGNEDTVDKGSISNSPGNIDPGKDVYLIDKEFDRFLIFCGGATEMVYIDDILKTELISEEDKNTLKSYCIDNSLGKGTAYFNIYLGEKDNKDKIIFALLSGSCECFSFDSNLKYSLKSIVDKFEEISGEKLTQEFLKEIYYKGFTYQLGGITMRFVNSTQKTLAEYYTAIINGNVYVLPSSQIN